MIEELADAASNHLILFVLVLTRLGTLMSAMPIAGRGIPRRIRALLAVTLSSMITMVLSENLPENHFSALNSLLVIGIAIAREALLGMLIGATVQFLLTGVQAAGEMISSTGGMQLGESVDPTTRSSTPTLARLIGLMVTAVMLASGGHEMMLRALLDSFTYMPPGQIVFHDGMLELVVHVLSRGMEAGIRVGSPVVAVLLLANILTGLISRTLPQINVLAIGLNLNAIALMLVSAFTLGAAGWIFSSELNEAMERVANLW